MQQHSPVMSEVREGQDSTTRDTNTATKAHWEQAYGRTAPQLSTSSLLVCLCVCLRVWGGGLTSPDACCWFLAQRQSEVKREQQRRSQLQWLQPDHTPEPRLSRMKTSIQAANKVIEADTILFSPCTESQGGK